MTKDEIILAQQARIEQLREAATLALETIESNAHERRHVRWKLKDALSFHDNLSALRAHDVEWLERYRAEDAAWKLATYGN